jgi:[acyl-carrier-protein] S-malonyltransferase
MVSIQQEWNEAVAAANFSVMQIPVIGNVHAMPLNDENAARADIIGQMQSRVRWTESVEYMVSKGVNTFVEVGTGAVLGGLVKRIADGMNILPLGNPQDFAAMGE